MTTQDPILILSDLHLGHPASRIQSPEQLRPLIREAATLVLCGDTLEEISAHFAVASRTAWRELASMCAENGTSLFSLSGNHDPASSRLHYLELLGRQIFVTHGDVFFDGLAPWCKDSEPLIAIHRRLLDCLPESLRANHAVRLKLARKCALAVEDSSPVYSHRHLINIALLVHELLPPARILQILKYWRMAPFAAARFAAQCNLPARLVCFGHTHRPGIWHVGARTIVNTGAFMRFSRPLAVLLTSTELHVFRIKDAAGEFRLGRKIYSCALQRKEPVFAAGAMPTRAA